MSKIQTIIGLFGFLIILFSMNLIFGNPLKETFKGIETKLSTTNNTTTNNTTIDGSKIGNAKKYNVYSDDQPLHFGFSTQK
jgi:hypothetical protein